MIDRHGHGLSLSGTRRDVESDSVQAGAESVSDNSQSRPEQCVARARAELMKNNLRAVKS
jgi:hypothetical protein